MTTTTPAPGVTGPHRRWRRLPRRRYLLLIGVVALGLAILPSRSSGAPSVLLAPPTASPGLAAAATGEVVVQTAEQLSRAMVTAVPGTVIRLTDGEYRFPTRLVASASGTAAKPITLRGSRGAMIRTGNTFGDYGLSITGDYWRVEGLTVAHASKGIVLDGSVGTVLDGVEIYDIGEEGVRFRSCSSDSVLRNSFIHDTGVNGAGYGEGAYVGSAEATWSTFGCPDAVERVALGDNTERTLIEGNVFADVPAEGVDVKEGTDSGTVRGNTFRRTGNSGQHQGDSAIDVKGDNWLIEDNTVVDSGAPWNDAGASSPSQFRDGFQTHAVATGYGTANVFHRNTVEGAIPGFGIRLSPALGNIVSCDNRAPGAALGLVGGGPKPVPCQG
jgi:hypothetical protein